MKRLAWNTKKHYYSIVGLEMEQLAYLSVPKGENDFMTQTISSFDRFTFSPFKQKAGTKNFMKPAEGGGSGHTYALASIWMDDNAACKTEIEVQIHKYYYTDWLGGWLAGWLAGKADRQT